MRKEKVDFQSAVIALSARLGLEFPSFVEPESVQLKIGETTVDLLNDGRGMLVIEGVAGNLSSDVVARTGEMFRILTTNLGLLIDNDAGIYIKRLPGERMAVVVRSSCRYVWFSTERLLQKIEDVVSVLEYYAGGLDRHSLSVRRVRRQVSVETEPPVVFRP